MTERPPESSWLPPEPPGEPAGQAPPTPAPAAPGPQATTPQAFPQAAWSQPVEPPNKPANTGFALSIAAVAVLVTSVGFLAVVALPLAIAGWVNGREGVQKVERGETRRNETLARSAVIVGIVTTVLSALAIVALIVLIATAPHFFKSTEH